MIGPFDLTPLLTLLRSSSASASLSFLMPLTSERGFSREAGFGDFPGFNGSLAMFPLLNQCFSANYTGLFNPTFPGFPMIVRPGSLC